MLKIICIVFSVSLVILACKKEVNVPTEGIYRGVFNEIRNSGDTVASGLVYMALWESSLTFQIVGDTNTNAPANHSGSFLVDDATRMQFYNNSTVSGQYDPDHYLDTTYEYFFDNTIFEFSYQQDTTLYEYRLTRN